jgi:predicted ABC-type ATPase
LKNKCYIIAGPNGTGKTTFANEFLPIEAECLNFINADLIAQGLSPFQPNKMAIEAGRLMLQNINECVKKSESFAFETTLSGKGYINNLVMHFKPVHSRYPFEYKDFLTFHIFIKKTC